MMINIKKIALETPKNNFEVQFLLVFAPEMTKTGKFVYHKFSK